MKTYLAPITLSLCFAMAVACHGQTYTPDMDNGADWTIVADEDTNYEFGFDYSKFGIPSSPNGDGTTGLWMAANLVAPGAAQTLSATPNGISMSGKYEVKFDFWLNFNTSGGTTEAGGAFVGFDAADGSPTSGAGFIGNTDGDSSRDYQLFKDGSEQFIESGQYDIPSQDHTDPVLAAQFPGQTTPAEQNDGGVFSPTNVIVTAQDGTLAYAWHEMVVTVDSDAGTANFAIDGFSIGTVDSNVGDAVDLAGGVALTYRDPFGSVASKPEFAFGIFDNLTITQVPEPSSALLALLGLLGFAGIARKRS